jgi:hypothetical protein
MCYSEMEKKRRKKKQKKRRNGDQLSTELLMAEFKAAKEALRKEIRKSKAVTWESLLEEVDKDPWGRAYRIVTRKMGARTPLASQEISHAVEKLFPTGQERRRPMPPVATCTPFTIDEQSAAAGRLRGGKAPGPDGVPPEVIKLAVATTPEEILRTINDVFKDGHFPESWKVGRLVLIPKKETDGVGRPKVRPICLLDVMGKLYEHLIKARLLIEVEEKGGLSDRQFGFREGMSTIDAIEDVLGFVRIAHSGSWGGVRICAP